MKYDVVWYWVGGTEAGEWRECVPDEGLEADRERLKRMGYVAYLGRRSIGPPEGPPDMAKFFKLWPAGLQKLV